MSLAQNFVVQNSLFGFWQRGRQEFDQTMQVDAIRHFSLHSPLPLLHTAMFLQVLFLADASRTKKQKHNLVLKHANIW